MGRRRCVDHSFFPAIEKFSSAVSFLFPQMQSPFLQGYCLKIPHLYWKSGKLLAEHEQQEAIKEENRPGFLLQLTEHLIKKFGNQFTPSMLEECFML